MNFDNPFVRKTAEQARNLLETELSGDLTYHTIDHTTDVVESSLKIGRRSGLDESDLEILLIAAWMHDVGYIRAYSGHEEEGVRIASTFLRGIGYPEERIARVAGCIMATKVPQSPHNLLEEILCDADLSHLGKKDFEQNGELLRVEWERYLDKQLTDIEWLKVNRDFLKGHRFHTSYAALEYEPQRIKNLLKLQRQLRKLRREEKAAELLAADRATEREEKGEELKPEPKPNRGIETMFRTTAHNHMELSAIADHKANLMITTNSLVVSVVVALLGGSIQGHPTIIPPMAILIASCLTAIIFATLSTRPTVNSGRFTRDDVKQRRVNLLFFGNFFNMPVEEYEEGVQELMNDPDYLYGSMIKDIYFLGRVLERKYRYLKICYSIFMYGLIASVLAFGVTYVVSGLVSGGPL